MVVIWEGKFLWPIISFIYLFNFSDFYLKFIVMGSAQKERVKGGQHAGDAEHYDMARATASIL